MAAKTNTKYKNKNCVKTEYWSKLLLTQGPELLTSHCDQSGEPIEGKLRCNRKEKLHEAPRSLIPPVISSAVPFVIPPVISTRISPAIVHAISPLIVPVILL